VSGLKNGGKEFQKERADKENKGSKIGRKIVK
jgi:hypothetical protein